MNNDAHISVIIPAHNRREKTRRAITSVLSQRVCGEVIVVDDASHEPVDFHPVNSGPMSVKIIRTDINGGAAAARNRGIQAAKGPLLTFLDNDDTLIENTLQSRVDFACAEIQSAGERAPIVVSCGWNERKPDRQLLKTRTPIESSNHLDFLLGCWFCPGSTIIAPVEVFKAPHLQFDSELRRLEDYERFIRFAFEGGRLVVQPLIGVDIEKTSNKSVGDVEAAIRHIERKFAAPGNSSTSWPEQQASRQMHSGNWENTNNRAAYSRKISAYLNYELAKLNLDQARYPAATIALLKSFIQEPRTSIYPGLGWRSPSA